MLTLENLLLSACFLGILHFGSRFGLRHRALSVSESFVLGHWPFLFLNLVILYHSRGFDWTALDQFDQNTLSTAQWVVALGLVSFLMGGLFAVASQRLGGAGFRELEIPVATTVRVAMVLVTIGLAATIPNVIAMATQGPGARSTILLGLGHFLAPGGLLCLVVARERSVPTRIRFAALAFFLVTVTVLSFNWSRRPLLVTVAAALMLTFVQRRGHFSRRRFATVVPVLIVLAIGALVWRDVFVHGREIYGFTEVVDHYANSLWLESSAFSALMWTVDTHGLMQVDGEGSLLLPIVFWIPRSIFPAKPAAFDPGAALGTPYSIGPSIYGEALVNVTIVGLVPFMAFLGFFFKWLDLAVARNRLSGAAAAIYALLILDAIFLVRGSFHTMFTPIMLHLLVPAILFVVDKTLSNHFGGFRSVLDGEVGR